MGLQEENEEKAIHKRSRYLKRFKKLMQGQIPEGKLVGPVYPMQLLGDMILVERFDKQEKTIEMAGGHKLYVADAKTHKETYYDQAAEVGVVLAVGPGQLLDDGSVIPCVTKPGDVVLLSGHIDWYSEYLDMKHYVPGTIGRVRDSNLCQIFTDYDLAMELLNEEG